MLHIVHIHIFYYLAYSSTDILFGNFSPIPCGLPLQCPRLDPEKAGQGEGIVRARNEEGRIVGLIFSYDG